jgi:hypothetical protein
VDEPKEVNLEDLNRTPSKPVEPKTKEEEPRKEVPRSDIPIEEYPMVEKSKGGGHLKKTDEVCDDLSEKDFEAMIYIASGLDKTKVANLVGCDRRTLYRLLNSERVERFTKGAKKRLAALAPLAVELIHNALLNGDLEVAKDVLKGMNVMRSSVNAGDAKVKERSIAEEIVEANGKTTRKLTKEREVDD